MRYSASLAEEVASAVCSAHVRGEVAPRALTALLAAHGAARRGVLPSCALFVGQLPLQTMAANSCFPGPPLPML